VEGLVEGRAGALRLGLVALEAFMGLVAATLAGFGVLFGVSLRWGHGALLRTVMISMSGLKATLSHPGLECNPKSDNATPHERSVSISPV
jgi:hypothetical protein